MCLFHPNLTHIHRWNWDGDHIVFESIVPSSRRPIGQTRGKGYDIDVREFLVSENNAVTKRVLSRDLPAHFQHGDQQGVDLSALTRRQMGDFDMRAHLVASYVSATIQYKTTDGRDPWQFPDETLSLKKGDCEDIAFLLASLLLASGISGYNVRVALGKVISQDVHGSKQRFDHMWVMYKCEAGHWLVLEPLRLDSHRPQAPVPTKGKRPGLALSPRPPQVEYRPYYLFNQDHLWLVKGHEDCPSFQEVIRRKWTRLHPTFAGQVHRTILHDALEGVAPQFVRDALDRHFSRIAGISPVIDDIDNFLTHGYDSRDHFDNGLIPEGWQRVHDRLNGFSTNNSNLDLFAYAAHGIADFYAHSSYLHFAKLINGAAQPYDESQPGAGLIAPPTYAAGSSFDLATGPFSINNRVFAGSKADAAQIWNGKLISGRYAQAADSHSVLETLTFIPKDIRKAPGFAQRGGLPHHNEIAVDEASFDNAHLLYKDLPGAAPGDRTSYQNQFAWRRNTAVLHIRQAFQQHWHGAPT